MCDLQITENFINDYFNSEKTLCLHKIYLISNEHAHSQKFFKFVKDILKKLIKKRINGISIGEIYEEHIWFLKMLDIFNKIFRDTKRMNQINYFVRNYFNGRLLILKERFLEKTVLDFFYKDIPELEHFLILDSFYALNYRRKVEDKIIEKYISDIQDYDISDIRKLIENIDNEIFEIKERLLREICKIIDDFKILKCLQDKENFSFLTELYFNDADKYTNLISIYIIEKYNLDDVNNISSDDHYVDNILSMYEEYKEFDDSARSVFYKAFKEINIQYSRFIKVLNSRAAYISDWRVDTNILDPTTDPSPDITPDSVPDPTTDISLDITTNSVPDPTTDSVPDPTTDIIPDSNKKSHLLYEFLGLLYEFINEKESYERELRKSLCIRLINGQSTIQKEEGFLEIYKTYAKDIYCYKMVDVIEDYKKRIIFNNAEIMMMRKFQWVDVQTSDISIEEVDNIKKKYEEQIVKYERKKIVWIDYLSTVEIEINGKIFVVNLIQYDILRNIEDMNYNKRLEGDYKKNFDYLIKMGLLIINDDIIQINETCSCQDLTLKDNTQWWKLRNLRIIKIRQDLASKSLIAKLCRNLKEAKSLKLQNLLV